jgi:hypothetical protein
VGERLDIGQGIMEDMDLSNPALDAIIRALREDPGIQGAKISGSGLGDCAIGLGHTSPGFPFPPIPVAPAPRGAAASLAGAAVDRNAYTPRPMRALRKVDVGLVLGEASCMPQQAEGRAFAPSNIALCKYWGKRNEELNLPITSSLSVSLGHLGTTTLITMRSGGVADEILLNGAPVPTRQAFAKGVTGFLNLFRPNPPCSTGWKPSTPCPPRPAWPPPPRGLPR